MVTDQRGGAAAPDEFPITPANILRWMGGGGGRVANGKGVHFGHPAPSPLNKCDNLSLSLSCSCYKHNAAILWAKMCHLSIVIKRILH